MCWKTQREFEQTWEEGNEDGRVFLRFGKMAKARFSLDFRDPFSPVSALGVAVTTFAKKRVVT